MCGITGHINFFGNNHLTEDTLHKMNESMFHRGPDSSGTYIDNNYQIGMRRLSIIDQESGDQPIISEDKQVIIIMNGEIFNYSELKCMLKKDNFTFKTKSDTEVLLKMYIKYGISCLKYINGMFSFCIIDKTNQNIWLCRDRFGIKPLYYGLYEDSLIFGSTLDAIISSNLIKPIINSNAVELYFFLSYIPTPLTIYKNINKLEPGHIIKFTKDHGIETIKYWDVDMNAYPICSIDEVDNALDRSIIEHAVSDRPVGTFLSGGLDSSLITLMFNKLSTNYCSYTAISSNKTNDNNYSKKIAKILDIKNKRINIDKINFLQLIDDTIKYFDEPVYDSSIYPTYLLSKQAKHDGVDVLLAGNGADEIFGGYKRYYSKIKSYLRGRLKYLNLNIIRVIGKIFRIDMHKFIQLKYKYIGYSIHYSGNNLSEYGELDEYKLDSIEQRLEKYFCRGGSCDSNSLINNMKNIDQKCYLIDNGLSILDKCTMANSVEGRVPYLDHNFFEKGNNYSSNKKSRYNNSKIFIRDKILDSEIDFISKRDKEGFNMPVPKSFHSNENKEKIRETLYETRLILSKFIDFKIIDNMLKDFEKYSENIYSIYLLSKWFQSRKVII